jgi:membrane-associated phospholipid phosphatase
MRIIYLFLLFCLVNSNGFSQNLDIELLRKINVSRNQKFDKTFQIITHSDNPVIFAGPLSVLATGLITKDKLTIQKGMVMGGTLCLNGILTVGMKYGFNRSRPFVTYPEIQKLSGAGSYSFPSGHSSSAFAFATSISLAYPKWYVVGPSFVWAGLVGYSRMHLGVHYPSDVVVGALLGIGSGFLMHYIGKNVLSEYPGYPN